MIHIIDNTFPENELEGVQRWASSLPVDDTWYELHNMMFGKTLLDIASRYFDLSDAVGCEMHVNYHTPFRHYDKDEHAWRFNKQLIFPLCAIVYYPKIEMVGGQIIFPEADVGVTPKTNRTILFRGDLLHEGVPFDGYRQSVGINPWLNKPMKYRNI